MSAFADKSAIFPRLLAGTMTTIDFLLPFPAREQGLGVGAAMRMNKNLRTRRAFTMIELLVVIAIIAILAAILFPVFAVVREQARQSSTMSNMQAVYTGARLYNEDEGHYPSVLFGYAEVPAPGLTPPYLPATSAGLAGTTPMHNIAGTFRTASGSVLAGYLYHEQIKDYVTFLAGDDAVTDQTQTTIAYYPRTLCRAAVRRGQLLIRIVSCQ